MESVCKTPGCDAIGGKSGKVIVLLTSMVPKSAIMSDEVGEAVDGEEDVEVPDVGNGADGCCGRGSKITDGKVNETSRRMALEMEPLLPVEDSDVLLLVTFFSLSRVCEACKMCSNERLAGTEYTEARDVTKGKFAMSSSLLRFNATAMSNGNLSASSLEYGLISKLRSTKLETGEEGDVQSVGDGVLSRLYKTSDGRGHPGLKSAREMDPIATLVETDL